MHGAAIVPDQDVALAPAVAVLILRLSRVIGQRVEQRVALRARHADDRLHAVGVHVERAAASLRMGADERMDDGGQRRRLRRVEPGDSRALAARIVGMHDLEPVDAPPQRRRQAVIGGVHVDELGIAADRRHGDAVEDGERARHRLVAVVAVPMGADDERLAVAQRVAILARQDEDLRHLVMEVACPRLRDQCAEDAHRFAIGERRQSLAADAEDKIVEQRLAQAC